VILKRYMGLGLVLMMLVLSNMACEKASEWVTEAGIKLEQEFGEGSGWEAAFPEDGPDELSSFCKSMLPMGIFMQEADAEGVIYPEEMRFFGGSWVQCVFEWEGDGVWCEWGYINHEETVSDCWTTPDPQRNRPEPERCVAEDRVNGAFCGEYIGGSITGITNVTKVELRYELNESTGKFRHVEEPYQQGGVMFCNVMANETCVGTWSTGELHGDWQIKMP
jgi:hypothetical protein